MPGHIQHGHIKRKKVTNTAIKTKKRSCRHKKTTRTVVHDAYMDLTASSAPNKSLKMKNSRILDNYSTRFLPPWARRSQNTVRTVVRDAVNIEQFEVERGSERRIFENTNNRHQLALTYKNILFFASIGRKILTKNSKRSCRLCATN